MRGKGAMLAGTVYGAVFLAFAVALVAFMAALVRGVPAAAGSTLVVLLGALAELTAGKPAADYFPGVAVGRVKEPS